MIPAKAPRWRLVWRDEFDGNSVDPTQWDFDIGNGFYDYKNHLWIAGWGNEEMQYYTRDPANVFVKDSVLDGVVWARQGFWWRCSRTDAAGQGPAAASQADVNPWPAPFDQPFYQVMNMAVGGNFPGAPPPATPFPADLQVDYVRVYQRIGGYAEATPRGAGRLPWHKPAARKRSQPTP